MPRIVDHLAGRRPELAEPSVRDTNRPTAPDQPVQVMERERLFLRFWQTALGFWRGPASRIIWILTALLLVGVLVELALSYRLNLWTRDFFDALERKDGSALLWQALLFTPLAVAAVALATLEVWGRMSVQRKWRKWLTGHLIECWLADDRYRRLDRSPGVARHPEYRIAEDARVATDAPVDFAVGLVKAVLTAIIFIGVLWHVGGNIAVDAFGRTVVVPGYLVIGVVVYALGTTGAMLVAGRRLVHVIENKNHAEAELRRAASSVREDAASDGDGENRVALRTAVGPVIARWHELCGQLMRTTVISQSNTLVAPVIALCLCAPKYLAGTMSLGEVTQAAAAFFAVQAAFNWLVENYPRVADWTSAVNRVASLLISLDGLHPISRPQRFDASAQIQHRPRSSAAD
jgi:putative ATP-binding cassette transporter